VQKIDIHTHIMPATMPNWAQRFGYEGFIHLDHHKPCCARMMIGNKFFREIHNNCWDADVRKDECQVYGVTHQVLSTIPVLFNYWAQPRDALQTAQFLNDHIAKVVAEHPTCYYGLGTLPLQDIDLSITELERCLIELGLKGIEIGSHINQWNLNAPELYPLWDAAEKLGACIFVHPWDMVGKDLMPHYWLPWLVGMPAETSLAICSMILGGVFEKYPRLRVAFAHGGGAFPASFGRIAHGYEVRPDLVAIDNPIHPSEYLGKFWLDSLVHDTKILKFIIELVGDDKVCMGSDYPFPLGEHHPGKAIEGMTLSQDVKSKLLYQNALQWLG